MAKRRRSRAGLNWKTDIGGMPVWAIAAVSAIIVGIVGVVAVAPIIRGDASATPYVRPSDAFDYSTPTAAPVYVRPTDRPLEIVFAGDSITYGLFASTEAAGYRPQVVGALEAGGPVTWSRGGQTGNQVKTVSDSITFPPTTDLSPGETVSRESRFGHRQLNAPAVETSFAHGDLIWTRTSSGAITFRYCPPD